MRSTRGTEQANVSVNVAHCIHGLGLGGAQQVIKTIVRSPSAEGFRYFVYCSLDGPVRKEIEASGALVRVLARRLPKLDPAWASSLHQAMTGDQINVVHTHLFGDSLHGYLAARAAGLPVVVTLHSEWDCFSLLQQLGYRWLLRRCDRVVACSASSRRSIASSLRALANRVLTIRNGIETPRPMSPDVRSRRASRQELDLDPDVEVVAIVGRLSKEKGHRYLISAFARLVGSCDSALQLAIVGEGPLREKLQRQAAAEGVADLVVFTGFRKNVLDLLPSFDVVVFSSMYEGLPIALLEAMSCSRCVVATDVPGILEAVRPDREALVVPTGDVDRLCDAIRQAIGDPELRQRLGNAARRRFVQHFTADAMVSRYEALYREILADREQAL